MITPKDIAHLPQTPGVYFFRDAKKRVLYIGKATSLRSRVRSYLSSDIGLTRGGRIVKMLQDALSVTFEETDSVLEALIREAFLIKKYQPPYNVKEKDNKSYQYVVITKEDFPRVLIIRGREILLHKTDFAIKESFGPFTQSKSLREALRIVRKIFPFRDKCTPSTVSGKKKPCFNYQIGLCPGMCGDFISKADYHKQVRHISLFLQGKKKQLLSKMKTEMKACAGKQQFEKAERIKRQIFALEHIQDVSLISEDVYREESTEGFRIESFDVAHMAGQNVVGGMVVMVDGALQKSEYKKFIIKGGFGNNDTASLREMLERRFLHTEWDFPQLIVLDGSTAQLNTASQVLRGYGIDIPLVAVTKDERHKAREIKGDVDIVDTYTKNIIAINAEVHRYTIGFFRKRQGKNLLS